MRLTILGGGGFRTPLVYGALLTDHHERRVDEVRLHDVDGSRLEAIGRVLAQMGAGYDDEKVTKHATKDGKILRILPSSFGPVVGLPELGV